ncbi:MAG: Bax inhibitor-1/YccA family protein [Spirochaetales bacterium]|nr:Bax inhibitor-1/YccA family protein [Spirochaetales bacterium]
METGFFASATAVRQRTILRNTYLWMVVGLTLTAAVAWWAANTPAVIQAIFGRGMLPFLVLMGAEFALVLFLSRRIMTMSVPAAVGGFALYSVLNGLTLSMVFLAYTRSTIFDAFLVAALMFGVMAFWATVTKRDLSGWGHFLGMAVVGLLITSVLGLFIPSLVNNMLFSAAGVVLFTVLTAYDTQAIKKMSDSLGNQVGEEDYVRLSIMGALKLYLDFINMFLFLLRFFGRRN